MIYLQFLVATEITYICVVKNEFQKGVTLEKKQRNTNR